jgi:hypothetical protein
MLKAAPAPVWNHSQWLLAKLTRMHIAVQRRTLTEFLTGAGGGVAAGSDFNAPGRYFHGAAQGRIRR